MDGINWIIDVIKSIPQDFLSGIIISFITLCLKKFIERLGQRVKIVGSLMVKIKTLLKWYPEISDGYTVLPSPKYKLKSRKLNYTGADLNDSSLIVLLFVLGIMIAVIMLKSLKIYRNQIQTALYSISLFFMALGIIFVMVSVFTNKIQKSTLNFSLLGISLSFYTYYSASQFLDSSKKIPDGLNFFMIFSESDEFWTSLYLLVGLIILFVEILFVFSLLVRMVVIKIDSLNSSSFTRLLISKTSRLDSIPFLITVFLVFTGLSYLFTSGILLKLLGVVN